MTHRLGPVIFPLAFALAAPVLAGTTFSFPMTGREENPPVASTNVGECVAILSTDESTLDLHCTHDLTTTTAAHIHTGAVGINGPVLFGLGDGTSPIQATWNPTAADVAALLVGGLYVNVHSPEFPGGEIRGQLRPDNRLGEQMITFPLEGAQETPPVTTTASGECLGTIDGSGELSLTCLHTLPATTAAHIHIGPREVAGPVVIDLGSGTSPIRHTVSLAADQLESLLAGEYYVNVHTSANPGGEIRGQIDTCFEGAGTLCLNDRRFEVQIDWTAPPDSTFESGIGIGTRLSDDSGTFWFFNPANVELTIKVLDACIVNDHYWVFFSGLTNVEYELRVVDTETGVTRTYNNPQGQPAVPVQDGEAFATCP